MLITRNEETYKDLRDHLTQQDDSYKEGEHVDFYIKGFTEGAKWADEHPNFENIWHDKGEEPKDSSKVLI